MQCLLIETKDHRKFLTYEKYLMQLTEFSKTFNARISLVQIDDGEILDLEDLAPALCNSQYKNKNFEYKTIQTKIPVHEKNRNQTLKIATEIQTYIKNQFQKKETVSLKEIKLRFNKYNLSSTTLCNHIRKIKTDLQKAGYKFEKTGAGAYKATLCTT